MRNDQRIEVSRWSTGGIAPARRFEVWSSRPWPSLARLFDVRAIGAFDTSVEEVQLGGIFAQFAFGTGRRYERNAARIREDAIDILGVGLLRTGTIMGRTTRGPFRAEPGAIVLYDLAQPFEQVMSRGESVQLAVSRELATRHLGSVAALHGHIIPAERAALAQNHVRSLKSALPVLTVAQGPRVAGTMLDVLALALGSDTNGSKLSGTAWTARQSAENAIERRLGEITLDTATLCAELGMSRATLFRLFKPDGGILAYARTRRLEHVRRVLEDQGDRVPLASLAEAWGFSDASHLSRLFRLQYGLSPSTYRKRL